MILFIASQRTNGLFEDLSILFVLGIHASYSRIFIHILQYYIWRKEIVYIALLSASTQKRLAFSLFFLMLKTKTIVAPLKKSQHTSKRVL